MLMAGNWSAYGFYFVVILFILFPNCFLESFDLLLKQNNLVFVDFKPLLNGFLQLRQRILQFLGVG